MNCFHQYAEVFTKSDVFRLNIGNIFKTHCCCMYVAQSVLIIPYDTAFFIRLQDSRRADRHMQLPSQKCLYLKWKKKGN